MSTESTPPDQAIAEEQRPRRPRIYLLAIVLGILAAIVTVVWLIPEDFIMRGMKMSTTIVGTTLAVILSLLWFLTLSRAPGRIRLAVLGVALLCGTAAVASVRRLEFTGNMVPIFEFRWQQSREARLAAHRAALAKAEKPAPIDAIQLGKYDVPAYRGERRDGIIFGPPLARRIDGTPEPIWRQPVGGGHSAFIVVGGLAITIEQRGDSETIVCYDAASGREDWLYGYLALFNEALGGPGPRATPTYYEGNIYSLGGTGDLVCLAATSGEEIWRTNILEQNDVANLPWGMSGSPLVYDGIVVVNPGTQDGNDKSRGLVAYDAKTGEIVWKHGKWPAGYSSPMLAEIDGVRQILMFDGKGLNGHDAQTGEPLWRTEWPSYSDINASQPAVVGNRVLITSDSGCGLYEVTQAGGEWKVDELWRNDSSVMRGSYASPIIHDGYIYGLDKRILVCLDLETGKRVWKNGRYGHGQLLLQDDLLIVMAEDGRVAIVEATPEKYNELASFQGIEGRTWNQHALADGRLYIRNNIEMACYDLRAGADDAGEN